MSPLRRPVGVGVVGFGWMGAVHTRAYLRVRHHFPDLAVDPLLIAVADPEPGRAAAAAAQYGFARATTHWRELVDDPAIEVVSITAPNVLHTEIGVATAKAGKHLWIEKPVGLDVADAEAVAQAAATAGVRGVVGFNYRHAPAVAAARDLLRRDGIGAVTHARFRLFSDYAAHPQGALSWRFTRARGGAGVLGDLASHGVDLIRHLLGDIDTLVADTAVFVPQRPTADGSASHFALAAGAPAPVENEDFVSCLLRTTAGARVTLEASRVSVAEQNNYGFEIHGTRGMLTWDFRRMGELGVSLGDGYADRGLTTELVGPGRGDFGAFQPGSGIAMSYDDLKVIEAAAFLRSLDGGPSGGGPSGGGPSGGGPLDGGSSAATLDDAVAAAVATAAMAESVRTAAWVPLGKASTP